MAVDSKHGLPFQKLYIYQTRSRVYVVGNLATDTKCRVLKLSRQDAASLEAVEDPSDYTAEECNNLLSRIHEGNANHGGLQLVCEAYGIIGCFRFTEGYYLLAITKREYVGSICGHRIYKVADTQLLPLSHTGSARLDAGAQDSLIERRYRKLLLGVDLAKNFFFSHTYCLANTLQRNHDLPHGQDPHVYDNMFVWNSFLTRDLRRALGSNQWTVPLIHGYLEQRVVSVFGRQITVTLVARRSRHFAGTRFRKRGLNDLGQVANEVETEQVVDAGMDYRTGQPLWSSVVQVRGSIPLYWTQEANSLQVKPDIVVQQFDPLYSATAAHLQDLRQRYGNPLVVLNLLKSREKRARETVLRRAFAEALTVINAAVPEVQRAVYIPWDFNQCAKQPGANLLLEISTVTRLALDMTGIYLHNPQVQHPLNDRQAAVLQCCPRSQRQHGVLRTNCIDCLDRTNVAQFAFGLMAFGRQLHDLGISDSPEVDSDSSVSFNLMEMYEEMGHTLALQYGGSEAHAVFFQRKKGEWEAATQGKDLFTSIRRFYSNAYTDSEKQDAINLFLGNFVPLPGRPHIWELETDYYLHTGAWARYAMQLHPCATVPLPVPLYCPADSAAMLQALASPFATPHLPTTLPPAAHTTHITTITTTSATRSGAASGSNHLLPAPSQESVVLLAEPSQAADPPAWDLRHMFGQLVGPAGPVPLARTPPLLLQLVCFDDALSVQPKVRQVRLYQGSQRRNIIMWAAVQQAFTFFWTLPEGAAGGGGQGLISAQELADLKQAAGGLSPTAQQGWSWHGGHSTATVHASSEPSTPAAAADSSQAPSQQQQQQASQSGALSTLLSAGLSVLDPGRVISALTTISSPKAQASVPVLNDIIEIQHSRPNIKYLKGTADEAMSNTAEYYSPRGGAPKPQAAPFSSNPTAVPHLNDIIEIRQQHHQHPPHLMAAIEVITRRGAARDKRALLEELWDAAAAAGAAAADPFRLALPAESDAEGLYSATLLGAPPGDAPKPPRPGPVPEPQRAAFESYSEACSVLERVAEHVTGAWGGSVPQWPQAREFLAAETSGLGLACDVELWWSCERGKRALWHASEAAGRVSYQAYLASVAHMPDPLVQRGLEEQYERFCRPMAMLVA